MDWISVVEGKGEREESGGVWRVESGEWSVECGSCVQWRVECRV
jgi:hypothetical protein